MAEALKPGGGANSAEIFPSFVILDPFTLRGRLSRGTEGLFRALLFKPQVFCQPLIVIVSKSKLEYYPVLLVTIWFLLPKQPGEIRGAHIPKHSYVNWWPVEDWKRESGFTQINVQRNPAGYCGDLRHSRFIYPFGRANYAG